MLGFAYDRGTGVARDAARAFEWFQKAAAKGDPSAQAMLGFKYLRGDGVAKDADKAIEWYRKAAAQGDKDALVKLCAIRLFLPECKR